MRAVALVSLVAVATVALHALVAPATRAQSPAIPPVSAIVFQSTNADSQGTDIYLTTFDGTGWSRPQPVVRRSGKDAQPSLSPRSRWGVFYSWAGNADKSFDVWIADLTGPLPSPRLINLTRGVTRDGAHDRDVSWDPAGRLVYYQSTHDGGAPELYAQEVFSDDAESALIASPRFCQLTRAPRRSTRPVAAIVPTQPATFRRLAFNRNLNQDTGATEDRVWTADLTVDFGSTVRCALSNEQMVRTRRRAWRPALSTDGSEVIYATTGSCGSQRNIGLYHLTRQHESAVICRDGQDYAPDFSPDDQWVVWTFRVSSSDSRIYIAPRATAGDPATWQHVTEGFPGIHSQPHWGSWPPR